MHIESWEVAMSFNDDYVGDSFLKKYYNVYMNYPHKCKKCGGSMHVPDGNLKCPKCKENLEEIESMLWD